MENLFIAIAGKLFDITIIITYFYLIYKLFKSTIKSYKEKETDKMILKIVISAILCFPMAIIELLYIQIILK